LHVVADQAGGKHTGDSRNRGKGGQPVWRSRRPIVEGMEMRTFGESQVSCFDGSGACFDVISDMDLVFVIWRLGMASLSR
jgi:hypothetical protein